MPIRLFGIHIAHGFSPEARVFAGLLSSVPDGAIDARVVFHAWDGGPDEISKFAARANLAGDALLKRDLGWRSISTNRGLAEKISARVRFQLAIPRLIRDARAFSPDVIYSSQQLWDCRAATAVARALNVPQAVHLHYTVGEWLHAPVLERLKTCDRVLAISEFIAGQARAHGVDPTRVFVVKNSAPELGPALADVRTELGLSESTQIAGICARIDPQKGQADAIEAWKTVVETVADATLLIVGDETPWHPGYRDSLVRRVDELGLSSRVKFLGRRSDIPELLAAMDVFVHPARDEPFGLAVAEASVARLPVVAWNDGAAPELIEPGVTGLLAPTGDIAALADSLTSLLSDRARARSLGDAGAEKMRRDFSPADSARAFLAALNAL